MHDFLLHVAHLSKCLIGIHNICIIFMKYILYSAVVIRIVFLTALDGAVILFKYLILLSVPFHKEMRMVLVFTADIKCKEQFI